MSRVITSTTDRPEDVKAAMKSAGVVIEDDKPDVKAGDPPDDNAGDDNGTDDKADEGDGAGDDDASDGDGDGDGGDEGDGGADDGDNKDDKDSKGNKDTKPGDKADDNKPKKLGGWQKKIQKQQQEIDRLNGKLDEARRGGNNKPDVKSDAAADTLPAGVYITRPKPKLADFKGDEDPYASLADAAGEWHSENKMAKLEQEHARQAQVDSSRAVRESFVARHKEVVGDGKLYPDYDEVLAGTAGEDIPLTGPMQYIIGTSGLAPDFNYFFANNPERARDIAQMDPEDQIMAMGEVKAEIKIHIKALESKQGNNKGPKKSASSSTAGKSDGKGTGANGSDGSDAGSDKAGTKTKTSKAPAPITPVGKKSSPAAKDLETVAAGNNFQEYERRRKEQGFKYR